MWSASDQMFCDVSANAAVPSAPSAACDMPAAARAGWLARTMPSNSQKFARSTEPVNSNVPAERAVVSSTRAASRSARSPSPTSRSISDSATS
jgi:hypothetical protein